MNWFARQELEQAGFPAATRELAFAAPIEDLAGGATELDVELRVDGVDGQARISAGYLPGGPVTSGQQLIKDGETRLLRKQLVKPGAVFVVVLDQPGRVDVRVAGSRGYDDDAQLEAVAAADDLSTEQPLGADDQVVQLIGAAAAATADRIAVMGAVLKRLDELLARAKKERSFSFLLVTGESSDQALAHAQSSMDFLHGPGFAKVASGEAPLSDPNAPTSWLDLAQDTGQHLQAILGDTDRWDLGSTASAVAPKVAEAVKQAAPAIESNLHWLVIGAIALAVVVVFK
jgi:hypothetical protein